MAETTHRPEPKRAQRKRKIKSCVANKRLNYATQRAPPCRVTKTDGTMTIQWCRGRRGGKALTHEHPIFIDNFLGRVARPSFSSEKKSAEERRGRETKINSLHEKPIVDSFRDPNTAVCRPLTTYKKEEI